MRLTKVHIKNFRSIKDEIIEIKENCIILLGKNEAGKSNILKSIAALFEKYPLKPSDKRKKIKNENIEEYSIYGYFQLEQKDLDDIIQHLNRIIPDESKSEDIDSFNQRISICKKITFDNIDENIEYFICVNNELYSFYTDEIYNIPGCADIFNYCTDRILYISSEIGRAHV